MKPVYWPMWLIDCDVDGHWQMEAGFDYQVESTKESFSDGQWRSSQQIENRIRWEPAFRRDPNSFYEHTCPALEDHQARVQQTGRYPLEKAQPYANHYLRALCN